MFLCGGSEVRWRRQRNNHRVKASLLLFSFSTTNHKRWAGTWSCHMMQLESDWTSVWREVGWIICNRSEPVRSQHYIRQQPDRAATVSLTALESVWLWWGSIIMVIIRFSATLVTWCLNWWRHLDDNTKMVACWSPSLRPLSVSGPSPSCRYQLSPFQLLSAR